MDGYPRGSLRIRVTIPAAAVPPSNRSIVGYVRWAFILGGLSAGAPKTWHRGLFVGRISPNSHPSRSNCVQKPRHDTGSFWTRGDWRVEGVDESSTA